MSRIRPFCSAYQNRAFISAVGFLPAGNRRGEPPLGTYVVHLAMQQIHNFASGTGRTRMPWLSPHGPKA
jgi:hypothetical protein